MHPIHPSSATPLLEFKLAPFVPHIKPTKDLFHAARTSGRIKKNFACAQSPIKLRRSLAIFMRRNELIPREPELEAHTQCLQDESPPTPRLSGFWIPDRTKARRHLLSDIMYVRCLAYIIKSIEHALVSNRLGPQDGLIIRV